MFTGPWELHVDNIATYLVQEISARYSVLNNARVLLGRLLKTRHKIKVTIVFGDCFSRLVQ